MLGMLFVVLSGLSTTLFVIGEIWQINFPLVTTKEFLHLSITSLVVAILLLLMGSGSLYMIFKKFSKWRFKVVNCVEFLKHCV